MTIGEEYISIFYKHQKNYPNKKFTLAYTVGKFFEFYSYYDQKGQLLGNAPDVAETLNIVLTKRDKSKPIDSSNTLMCGFQVEYLHRNLQILLNAGYIVAVYDQDKNDSTVRVLSQIYSSTTYLEHMTSNSLNANNISCVVVSKDNVVGMSNIDISTGKVVCHEVSVINHDQTYLIDETNRFLSIHNPKEVLLYTEKNDFNLPNEVNRLDTIPKEYTRVNFQEQFFQKVYGDSVDMNNVSVIENLNLEFLEQVRLSLVVLLNYVHSFNNTLIHNLQHPEFTETNKYFSLENTTIQQLLLDDLLKLIDFTSTCMGKRQLKERLYIPSIDTNEISTRYAYIQHILDKNISIDLKGILDLERFCRKIQLKTLQPFELARLEQSFQKIYQIINSTKNDVLLKTLLPSSVALDMFEDFRTNYQRTFNLEELSKYQYHNIETNIFNLGEIIDIDIISEKIKSCESQLDSQAKTLDGKLCLDSKTNTYYITIKNTKSKSINTSEYTLIPQSSNVRVSNDKIESISKDLLSHKVTLKNLCQEKYDNYISSLDTSFWKEIIRFIGEIDVYSSSKISATKYKYFKPEIHGSIENSFINATNVRHPLIEQLQTKTPYIPNDVLLSNNECGIVLFGTNSIGKSSYLKSIALNLIMAQAGFFVASDRFIFKPFTKIFSRLNSNDNIYKGLSSFAVEMLSLKSILLRSDPNSLVLIDECCNQTESISGLSITCEAINCLSSRSTKFIFTSHIHDIPKYVTANNVNYFHLATKYDENKKVLIYDRKLQKGSGSAIYGLEFAKSVGLDAKFVRNALEIRKRITETNDNILDLHTNRYNKNLIKDSCEVCKYEKRKDKNGYCISASDIHHIHFQKHADSRGYHEFIHKNHLSNVIGLCKKCHKMIDKPYYGKQLYINGWIQTNEGIKLDYEYRKT